MGEWRTLARVALAAALAVAANSAMAQTYRCTKGSSTYYSDRPCKQEFGAIGPQQGHREPAYQANTGYIPPVGKAPDHQRYMSATCASLNDAIRTGPARGLTSSTMNDMRNEYSAKCGEEERAAMKRAWEDRRQKGEEQRSQQMAEQAEQRRETTSREQCAELLRILAGKRRQFDSMNAGEKADFQRFEANYNQRCKGG